MAEPLNIALAGGGTVGGGVAQILLQHPDRIAHRAARPGGPRSRGRTA
jgi:homoserine dehydrogenase